MVTISPSIYYLWMVEKAGEAPYFFVFLWLVYFYVAVHDDLAAAQCDWSTKPATIHLFLDVVWPGLAICDFLSVLVGVLLLRALPAVLLQFVPVMWFLLKLCGIMVVHVTDRWDKARSNGPVIIEHSNVTRDKTINNTNCITTRHAYCSSRVG